MNNPKIALICLLLTASAARAEDLLGYLTEKYTGPTVEENIVAMDSDKNGFADVLEVRAFLELKHGKGFEEDLLGRWELHSQGSSCHAPFVKELYSDRSN